MKKIFTLISFFLTTIATAEEPKKPNLSPVVNPVSYESLGGVSYDQLSVEDKALLRQGEISYSQLRAGGFLGTFIGFGSGHIPYEMYRSRGWIFTVGETGALLLAILGASGINNECTEFSNGRKTCDDVSGSRFALAAGVLGFIGLRIWETIDVWTIPSARNYEIRRIRQKMGRELTRSDWTISPALSLGRGQKTTSAGLRFSLNF